MLIARENRLLIDEAEGIAEGIDGIKTPLAPGPGFDLRVDFGKAKLPRSREKSFDIFDRKIEVIWIGAGIKQIAIRTRIEAGENYTVAVKIVPTRAHALTRLFKERAIKPGRGLDIRYWQDYAEEFHFSRPARFEIEWTELFTGIFPHPCTNYMV